MDMAYFYLFSSPIDSQAMNAGTQQFNNDLEPTLVTATIDHGLAAIAAGMTNHNHSNNNRDTAITTTNANTNANAINYNDTTSTIDLIQHQARDTQTTMSSDWMLLGNTQNTLMTQSIIDLYDGTTTTTTINNNNHHNNADQHNIAKKMVINQMVVENCLLLIIKQIQSQVHII
eukprot:UN23944